MQKDNDLIKCYNEKEIKEILKNNVKLVYVDTGMDEFIARYEDLPDVIVDVANKLYHSINLKIYDFDDPDIDNPILTTCGYFLDKCDTTVREDIIERLVKLQTEVEQIKDYKIIDEFMLDKVKDSLNKDDEMEK